MECRRCAGPLERPGDYCLVCETPNADAVVLDLRPSRAVVTSLLADDIIGRREITTVPESGDRRPVQLRNFAGLIADEIHRKRPETVYAAGDRDVLTAVRGAIHYPMYRVDADAPVEAVLSSLSDPELAVVDVPAAEKLGGSHTTLVGGRSGREAVLTVAAHPHVKKVIPGPIDASGASRTGVRAKATRADENGNVRLLLRAGSSVQENRIVTTARDRDTGERIRADLTEALDDAGLG